ncbi:MAG: CDP-glucose 4,6-dehydratase [Deltaproteobacteria bacterium]|nr:CDP-glucose 4,6-dehydratase [Deltaproteobacteria bacterium]
MYGEFGNAYKGTRVLITGHTGFKGSWLSLWLCELGAEVIGYALTPETTPNLFEISRLEKTMNSITGDIRDFRMLADIMSEYKPVIVFHLAAQAIVRKSYRDPVKTYDTNIMGTINIFEACRQTPSVKAIIIVTSDKCYENQEWVWGYRETDPVGGYDPYSASKGCAEIITESYRRSFLPLDKYREVHETLVASVRAGNVIGGGDWGEDRLVPDIIRAASNNEKIQIRSPHAIRPWQHVLEPLSGYLLLGQQLLEGRKEFSGAWNFGPRDEDHRNVLGVVRELQKHWSKISYKIEADGKNLHEAVSLKLDCSKAYSNLNWRPVWNGSATFAKTATWYKEFYESGNISSGKQLIEYVADAVQNQILWAVQ